MKDKGIPNGSDYAELWMLAPEQIGQLLPGPISAGMPLLAATDVALTGTDKANLVHLLNQAYLSPAYTTRLPDIKKLILADINDYRFDYN